LQPRIDNTPQERFLMSLVHLSHRPARALALLLLSAVALGVVACGGPADPETTGDATQPEEAAVETAVTYDPAILDVAGRTEDDHFRDEGFKPLEVYAFFGIEPGMTVVDLATSRMYNAHILAQIVGPEGKVIATTTYADTAREGSVENTQATLDERNVDGALDNVEIVGTLADIPAGSVDAIITVRNYHDIGEHADRIAAMDGFLRVLKPGGILGAVDAHTDKTDERDESVHRINEQLARSEIVEGGFEFVDSSDVLHNPEDTFDFDGRRPGDPIHRYFIYRWVQKFRKPMS
jgi:predicted methyltransferase